MSAEIPEGWVLFGHGARDERWAAPFHRLRERLQARAPGGLVEIAFLDFIAPPLPQAIEALAQRGVRRIRVVPVFVSQGGHLKADVGRLVEQARRRWPDIEIVQLPAIGEVDAVLDAIAVYALSMGS